MKAHLTRGPKPTSLFGISWTVSLDSKYKPPNVAMLGASDEQSPARASTCCSIVLSDRILADGGLWLTTAAFDMKHRWPKAASFRQLEDKSPVNSSSNPPFQASRTGRKIAERGLDESLGLTEASELQKRSSPRSRGRHLWR